LANNKGVSACAPGIAITAGAPIKAIGDIVADEDIVAASRLTVLNDRPVGDADIVRKKSGDVRPAFENRRPQILREIGAIERV
jgi:hypothetical protein